MVIEAFRAEHDARSHALIDATGLDIHATVDTLSVGSIEDGRFTVLATLPLAKEWAHRPPADKLS